MNNSHAITPETRTPIFEAEGLSKCYRSGKKKLQILQDVDLKVYPGEIISVLGASGIGKSTLLHILGLLDKADSGDIQIEGQAVRSLSARSKAKIRNSKFGFVFQFYHLLHELSALENVLLPAMISSPVLSWFFSAKKTARKDAENLLEEVGLKDRMHHRPSKLSGGERQRVTIARALLNHPKLLFCDEPTGNLDRATAREITDLLWRVRDQHGTSIVLVTHDLRTAEKADRIVVLSEGGHLREVSGEEAVRIVLS